jgi:hypothetical protein
MSRRVNSGLGSPRFPRFIAAFALAFQKPGVEPRTCPQRRLGRQSETGNPMLLQGRTDLANADIQDRERIDHVEASQASTVLSHLCAGGAGSI